MRSTSLALAGMVCVFANNGMEPVQPFYDSVAFLAAATAGLCVVMIRHLRHTETTSNIFASQCVFALGIGLLCSGSEVLITDPWVFALVLLASIMVASAQLCLTEALRHLSVAKGSTLQMLTPVVTAVASALLLGESFGVLEIIGGSAILIASYRITLERIPNAQT